MPPIRQLVPSAPGTPDVAAILAATKAQANGAAPAPAMTQAEYPPPAITPAAAAMFGAVPAAMAGHALPVAPPTPVFVPPAAPPPVYTPPTPPVLVTNAPAPPAATPAKYAPNPATLAKLNAMFAAPPSVPASVDELPDAGFGPYLGLASKRATKWPQLQAAGIQDGQFYVGFPNHYAVCHPLRFWMVQGDLFRTSMDSKGTIVKATADPTDETMDEHVVALIVVIMPNGTLAPCKAEFRRTSSDPGVTGLKAIREAATPEWAQRPENQVAASFAYPFGRVLMTATTQPKVSKANGNPYNLATATVAPATMPEMQALAQAVTSEEWMVGMAEALEGYENRRETFVKLCGK